MFVDLRGASYCTVFLIHRSFQGMLSKKHMTDTSKNTASFGDSHRTTQSNCPFLQRHVESSKTKAKAGVTPALTEIKSKEITLNSSEGPSCTVAYSNRTAHGLSHDNNQQGKRKAEDCRNHHISQENTKSPRNGVSFGKQGKTALAKKKIIHKTEADHLQQENFDHAIVINRTKDPAMDAISSSVESESSCSSSISENDGHNMTTSDSDNSDHESDITEASGDSSKKVSDNTKTMSCETTPTIIKHSSAVSINSFRLQPAVKSKQHHKQLVSSASTGLFAGIKDKFKRKSSLTPNAQLNGNVSDALQKDKTEIGSVTYLHEDALKIHQFQSQDIPLHKPHQSYPCLQGYGERLQDVRQFIMNHAYLHPQQFVQYPTSQNIGWMSQPPTVPMLDHTQTHANTLVPFIHQPWMGINPWQTHPVGVCQHNSAPVPPSVPGVSDIARVLMMCQQNQAQNIPTLRSQHFDHGNFLANQTTVPTAPTLQFEHAMYKGTGFIQVIHS